MLRSELDREIVRLAVPALAAEPLPALADTAIIGHLGTTELAALAAQALWLGLAIGLVLAAALVALAPQAVALLALELDWGITGVWCGLLALMAVRLATLALRFRGRRWAVVGAPAAPA